MKKDLELLIGHKLRGLKITDIENKEDSMLSFLEANKECFSGLWSYNSENNMMSYENGSFNCSFLFDADNVYMICKRFAKLTFYQDIPVQAAIKPILKPIKKTKKQYNLRYEFRNRLKVA